MDMTRTPRQSFALARRLRYATAPAVAAALIISSCSGGGDGDTSFAGGQETPDTVESSFEDFASCDAFISWTKAEMRKRVGPYGLDSFPWLYARSSMEGLNEAPMPDIASDAGGVMPDTSVTNTQEIDVDEGDIVETDGRFVYSIVDNRLRSVDLDSATLLDEIDLPTGESQMILSGARLIVVTSQWDATADTVVTIFGVADGKLTFESRTHLEGQQVSVRSVGDNVYVTIRSGIVERLDFVTPRDGTEDQLKAAEKRNRKVIDELTADQILPRMFDESEIGGRGDISPALDCSVVGHPNIFSGWGITWVARIPTTDAPNISGDVGILADSQNAYTSSSSLYVATTRWDDTTNEDLLPMKPEPVHTDLHAFSLNDSGAFEYAASGRVLGTLLNSYSMSEYEGVLRVATTSYEYDFGKGQDNGVHAFRLEDGRLSEVGSVRGLGRGEMIQGVRFDGPRGYVVTFRQVDPLYVLDLSNPESPELVGELKIPGYSTYLKPIDGDRVIAIGMSGTETGFITGVQVSVFDVADPSDPKLVATSDIGDWSEATWDPHAFLWWSQTGQIVVPRELMCEVPGSTECGSAVVLRLEGTQLSEQGRIVQWFPIRRSVIAQGRLVTVSAGGVLVTELDTLRSTEEIRFDVPGFDGEQDFPPLID